MTEFEIFLLYLVETVMDLRDEYRRRGQYEKADEIRERFSQVGIKIKD